LDSEILSGIRYFIVQFPDKTQCRCRRVRPAGAAASDEPEHERDGGAYISSDLLGLPTVSAEWQHGSASLEAM